MPITTDTADADVTTMPMPELRAERTRARRVLELSVMRSRQSHVDGHEAVDQLQARVHVLTEELIRRYCADLTLVDSLLLPEQPVKRGRR